MSRSSRTPSLTPSRSPSPIPPVQPDHFYGSEDISPEYNRQDWLDPEDDPLASRGIPVFRPTMEEFEDFEGYVTKIECWGTRSGIVKVIPPKAWTDSLPVMKEQLFPVKIRHPIEQHMIGRGGLFRQENVEKRRILSVREWVELCEKEDYRAPGVEEVGLHSRTATAKGKATVKKRKTVAQRVETAETHQRYGVTQTEDQEMDNEGRVVSDLNGFAISRADLSTRGHATAPVTPTLPDEHSPDCIDEERAGAELCSLQPPSNEDVEVTKTKDLAQPRETKEVGLAARASRDAAFLETFDPHSRWLPPNTMPSDYTQDFCQVLERQYWRNCGLGKPAWYGADSLGSLFTDAVKVWDVAHLPSTLSRLLPASSKDLPGVNTPYLYFGMWRATFAWHVEDMDLFSINFIHFGAPKFWYAVPQGRSTALEQTMRSYFPNDTSQCPQFLRHKSFLASPTLLAQSSCRPNILVQHAGEFVITFPRGYHAGFNLGLNCAESVNFALDSWLELGKRAQVCKCISDSVRIDVAQLLHDREMERSNSAVTPSSGLSCQSGITHEGMGRALKRWSDAGDGPPKAKKAKTKKETTSTHALSRPIPGRITLKLGPRPVIDPLDFPCCLCVSLSLDGLLRVQDPPVSRRDIDGAAAVWKAHEECASIVPETWIDEVEVSAEGGVKYNERVVLGVDAIVKDRWNLKCSSCSKSRHKAHGAPIQCTKGKCPKAFHVSCARDGERTGTVFCVLREVEKEVVILEQRHGPDISDSDQVDVEHVGIKGGQHRCDVKSEASITPSSSSPPVPRVLKIVRKTEVQVLCPQHNPKIAAAKKAMKEDKIRHDLVSLPPMTRIKIRVSAGVFEVSLIRVIEDTKSVEVLWDRGIKREFKWGSVVFGSTDGQMILQKPSEPAPQSQPVSSFLTHTVMAFPSVFAATSHTTIPGYTQPNHNPSSASSTHTLYNPYYYGAWALPQGKANLQLNRHSHSSCHAQYRDTWVTTPVRLHGQPFPSHHRDELRWQQPYTGSRPDTSQPHLKTSQEEGKGTIANYGQTQLVVVNSSTQTPEKDFEASTGNTFNSPFAVTGSCEHSLPTSSHIANISLSDSDTRDIPGSG